MVFLDDGPGLADRAISGRQCTNEYLVVHLLPLVIRNPLPLPAERETQRQSLAHSDPSAKTDVAPNQPSEKPIVMAVESGANVVHPPLAPCYRRVPMQRAAALKQQDYI